MKMTLNIDDTVIAQLKREAARPSVAASKTSILLTETLCMISWKKIVTGAFMARRTKNSACR